MPFQYIGTSTSTRVDRRRLLFVPSNYTRTVHAFAEFEDQLTAHLNGIDGAMGGRSTDVYVQVTGDTGSDTANGFDTIDFRGHGGITAAVSASGGNTLLDITNDIAVGPLGPWSSVKRYATSSVCGNANITQAGWAGTIYFSQIYIPRDYTLFRMYVQIPPATGGIDATKDIRLALYDDLSGSPNALLWESAAIPASSGVKQPDVLTEVLSGFHWLGFQSEDNVIGMSCSPASQVAPYIGENNGVPQFAQGRTMRTQAGFAFGPFPDPAVAGGESSLAIPYQLLSRSP